MTGVILTVSLLAVVTTGKLASLVGRLMHIGDVAVTVWDIAKWPVLVALISLMFAVLYYFAPNAKHGGFRWITPGGVLAVLIWLAASAGFALYVSQFGSYNKTYGTFAGSHRLPDLAVDLQHRRAAGCRVRRGTGARSGDRGRHGRGEGAVPAAARRPQGQGPGEGRLRPRLGWRSWPDLMDAHPTRSAR
jgi:hypothetical protein